MAYEQKKRFYVDKCPDMIYNTTKERIRKCRTGGNFILGNANAVAIETPVENDNAYLEAWRELK